MCREEKISIIISVGIDSRAGIMGDAMFVVCLVGLGG